MSYLSHLNYRQRFGDLPIFATLEEALENSKPSETGNSYYSTRCAKQAAYNKLARLQGISGEGSFNARVGTVFHKLAELYFLGKLGNCGFASEITFAESKSDAIMEGLRLFYGYAQIFPPDMFEVLYVEQKAPENPAQALLVEQVLGVPFTVRWDLVIRIRDNKDVVLYESLYGVTLSPGVYIVDHKTAARKDAMSILRYELSCQGTAYQLVWNALHPECPANGILFHHAVRHAKLAEKREESPYSNSFYSYYFPAPTEVQTRAVKAYYKYKESYLKTGQPDLMACTDWGGCYYYTNGICDRTPEQEIAL